MVYHCPACHRKAPPKYVRSGPHIKALCSQCGAFIKFIKKSSVSETVDPMIVLATAIKQLITALGYVQENIYRNSIGQSITYGEEAFQILADGIPLEE